MRIDKTWFIGGQLPITLFHPFYIRIYRLIRWCGKLLRNKNEIGFFVKNALPYFNKPFCKGS